METGAVFTTIGLSVRVAVLATLLNLPGALAVAWLLARTRFPGRTLVDGLVNLPLVMPPVTTGYLLLLLLGRRGLIGRPLFEVFGVRVAFTFTAAVLAAMVVSFPLIVRSIRVALDMSDRRLEQAAWTLGAGRRDTFLRVTLPLVMPGIANGAVLGFARSLGEFGATMTFAGNIAGETRTIPLAVYSQLQIPGGERHAALLVAVSVVISLAAMVASAAMGARLDRQRGRRA